MGFLGVPLVNGGFLWGVLWGFLKGVKRPAVNLHKIGNFGYKSMKILGIVQVF